VVGSVDSKAVSRELRAVVRPMLKDAGFTAFRGRDSWRILEGQTWVVSVQSFSSYLAEGVGCTTFSFSVRLGLRLADDMATPLPRDRAFPKDHEASFRFTALKRLAQPWFHPWGDPVASDRRDVWFVRADGSNLPQAVDDACRVIAASGLRQLEAYREPLYAYCALFDYARRWPPRAIDDDVQVIPSGAYDSPRWRELVQTVAKRVRRDPDADRTSGLPPSLLDEVLGI
jgi:hypothetical protein